MRASDMSDPWSRFLTEFDEKEVTFCSPFDEGSEHVLFHEEDVTLRHSPRIIHDLPVEMTDNQMVDDLYQQVNSERAQQFIPSASSTNRTSDLPNDHHNTSAIAPTVLQSGNLKIRRNIKTTLPSSTESPLDGGGGDIAQADPQPQNSARHQNAACRIAPMLSRSVPTGGESVAIQFMPQINPATSTSQPPSSQTITEEQHQELANITTGNLLATPPCSYPHHPMHGSPAESIMTAISGDSPMAKMASGILLPANEMPRRDAHMASEQRRRAMMRGCFDRLQRLLPPSEYRKPSKANLLQAAVNYITHLRRIEQQLRCRIQMIHQENVALRQQMQRPLSAATSSTTAIASTAVGTRATQQGRGINSVSKGGE